MNLTLEQEKRAVDDDCSEFWATHFRVNKEREWMIPWTDRQRLTRGEAGRIGASIAEFQRGESSEARGYLAKSVAFSGKVGDPVFHEVSTLFVAEENGHAALLLRFMNLAGLPTKKAVWSDGVFRWLRSWSDLGWASRVLIIAELIAQTYYPCLREATAHPVLRRICDKIVFDEADHIRFQVRRIARVELEKSERSVTLRNGLQRLLMIGAAAVVYLSHRGVLRSRLNFRAFVGEVLQRNEAALISIRQIRQRERG